MMTSNAILGAVNTQTLTQASDDAQSLLQRSGPVLLVLHAPDPRRIGDRLSLVSGETTTLGRKEPSFGPASLADPRISTRHVDVVADGDVLSVLDLGSKNGTFALADRDSNGDDRGSNGDDGSVGAITHRLAANEPLILRSGERFQIGGTLLQFAIETPFPNPDAATLLGGISARMGRLRAQVRQAASHGLPVMIVGPSGAGKERVARELHRLSKRGESGAFIALNCATLSEQLAASELFGHVRGAFTGADKEREGLFQAASAGTLFLDEINSLPASLQPKLLRAIQEGKVRRVGGTAEQTCRPRILCATNEEPTELVANGRLRADLYARLHGSMIAVPTLDEHIEDVGWLAHELLRRAGHPRLRLSAELVWTLLESPWPLHVRGLEQCLLASVVPGEDVLGPCESIACFLASQQALAARMQALDVAVPAAREPQSTPLENRPTENRPTENRSPPSKPTENESPPSKPTESRRKSPAKRPDRDSLTRSLQTHHGRIERVAQQFGVRRQQIYRWIDALGLELATYRDTEDGGT